ncbi:unnamed protein product [Wuchereria bancrofti]|uniref:PDZ domain-containing protein n=1 Tax=Wuchereria bancrofti TaxID=6293 RepID=A0A3P7E249_WUCBA|nr:unnamed protein product [Wuchereria bancrofti]
MSVNGVELSGKTHSEALQIFKKNTKIDVTLCIRRNIPNSSKQNRILDCTERTFTNQKLTYCILRILPKFDINSTSSKWSTKVQKMFSSFLIHPLFVYFRIANGKYEGAKKCTADGSLIAATTTSASTACRRSGILMVQSQQQKMHGSLSAVS